jgi:Protein of unknown function (DUF3568)
MSLFAFLPDAGRVLYVLMIVGSLAILSSCASPLGMMVIGSGSGVAMGTSVDYTLNGIAYRTFVSPMPNVRHAALNGLNNMGMKVTQNRKTDEGWAIVAVAKGREINIELNSMTPRTTRMRVVVADNVIFKDRATEAAVIDQTAEALGRRFAG